MPGANLEVELVGGAAQHGLRAIVAPRHHLLLLVDLDVIYAERDKELFCTGSRLPDQRRFNKWHLGVGTWQYFPITSDEINSNKNLK